MTQTPVGRVPRGHRPPTAGGAALRSALVPGWGQWAAGRRRRGALLAVTTCLAVAASAAVPLTLLWPLLPLLVGVPHAWAHPGALAGPALLAARFSTPALDWGTLWRSLAGANVLAGLFRAWAALDAA